MYKMDIRMFWSEFCSFYAFYIACTQLYQELSYKVWNSYKNLT